MDKLLAAVGMARKAGALEMGFDAVSQSAKKGDVELLLLASDVSAATRKRIGTVFSTPPRTLTLPHTQQEVAAVTNKPVGVLAVTCQNLATLCIQQGAPGKEEL